MRNFPLYATAEKLLWCALLFLNAFCPSPAKAAGITIITHGFELDSEYPTWVTAMADSIPNYFQARFPGLNNDCSTYRLTMTDADGVVGYLAPVRTNGSPPSATQSGEIIVELDWSQLSGNLFDSYASTSNVAFAVSKVLLATNSFPELNGHPAIEFPIHLVGHSRGGSLVAQLSFVLGTNGIWTDHLTTLDPYPINNDGNIDFPATVEDAPAQFTYTTVLFADNYWQNLGAGAYLGDPDGEAVNGAYARQLTNLSGGYGAGSDHENVHLWYYGTVDLATPADDTEATITSTERSEWWVPYEDHGAVAGFYYSLSGGGVRTNTTRPLGPGLDAIAAGYNQWWNFGAGNSTNRSSLPYNAGTWPNVIQFDVAGTNVLTAGEAIASKFYYQYGGPSNGVTAQFYFDNDFNPYNTNGIWISDIVLTNTGVDSISFKDVNLTTTNVAAGVYAIYAKISDGLHTRYLYAPELVEITNPQPTPGLSLSGDLAFGSVTVGTSAQSALVISNGGDSTITVSNITYPTGFSGDWSGTIPAGNSESVMVTFSPAAPINYGGEVTVVADNTSGINAILVSGLGTNGGTNTNGIAMSLSGDLAFGNVPVGSVAHSILTISNAGGLPLIVSNITYPTGFSGNWMGTIAAAATQAVTVAFSPAAALMYGGAVKVVADNTSGASTIPISGTGTNGELTLTVTTNGDGAVSPNSNGKLFKPGTTYTLTAVPAAGSLFLNWTGSITTNKNPLTVKVESNIVLQANFASNPFLAVKGRYNGLFFDTNTGVMEQTAGMLRDLSVNPNGSYSGVLWISGGSHAISGSFDISGQATNHIQRATSQGGPLTVEMKLNWNDAPPNLIGTVAGTNGVPWVANLTNELAETSSSSAAYTAWLLPDATPPGYGYILMTNHAGSVTLSVTLADGTSFSQSVPLCGAGDLPVYGNLYGGTGLLLGWINLESGSPGGNLAWLKPASHSTALYTAGFTNMVSVQGSVWMNPSPHTAAIELPEGELAISGGSLQANLTFNISVGSNNTLVKLPGAPTNSLTGSINPKTGLLTVKFGNGAGKATTAATGAVRQNLNEAAGFFLGKTNAGSIFLRPAL